MTADAADQPPSTTLAWIAAEAPDGAQSRALAAWARAHGVRLEAPRDERPPVLAVDPHAADDVERLLERARDAIAARDADAVDRALAAATSTLRAHPELPQAAWLMAEVERARSTRLRRVPPVDEEAAERAWRRAEALDGGRVPGVGEQAAATHPAAATLALEAPPGIALVLDGRPVESTATTREGAHALVGTWEGAPVWASWIEAPAGSSTVRVAAPAPAACSRADVAHARVAAGTVEAAQVRCDAWAAALPGAGADRVLVAVCEAGRCGPLLEWRAEAWTWAPPPEPPRHGWPTWATWGLVGAGAVIATGVVLVATGAFQSAPAETRFVSGGVQKQ